MINFHKHALTHLANLPTSSKDNDWLRSLFLPRGGRAKCKCLLRTKECMKLFLLVASKCWQFLFFSFLHYLKFLDFVWKALATPATLDLSFQPNANSTTKRIKRPLCKKGNLKSNKCFPSKQKTFTNLYSFPSFSKHCPSIPKPIAHEQPTVFSWVSWQNSGYSGFLSFFPFLIELCS